MAEGADLSFIHLGISVQNITKSFSIFGVSFAYYGLIIGIGMIAGLLVAQQEPFSAPASASERLCGRRLPLETVQLMEK